MDDRLGRGAGAPTPLMPDVDTQEAIHATIASVDKLKMLREKRAVLDVEITGIEERLLRAVIDGMSEEQQQEITEALAPSRGR
jgi:hypothetical protein